MKHIRHYFMLQSQKSSFLDPRCQPGRAGSTALYLCYIGMSIGGSIRLETSGFRDFRGKRFFHRSEIVHYLYTVLRAICVKPSYVGFYSGTGFGGGMLVHKRRTKSSFPQRFWGGS